MTHRITSTGEIVTGGGGRFMWSDDLDRPARDAFSPADASDLVIPLVDERTGAYFGWPVSAYETWLNPDLVTGDCFNSDESCSTEKRRRLATHRLRALAAAMNPKGWKPGEDGGFILIWCPSYTKWLIDRFFAYRFISEIPFATREYAKRALAIMQAEGLMDALRPR